MKNLAYELLQDAFLQGVPLPSKPGGRIRPAAKLSLGQLLGLSHSRSLQRPSFNGRSRENTCA